MGAVVYVNGTIRESEEAVISVFDHGFLFGEGIYETMRTYDRRPFLLDRHFRRLRRSADLMALAVPWSDTDLERQIHATMTAHPSLDEAYIRLLITRGVGELSYDPSSCPVPTLVIIVAPFVAHPVRTITHGIRIAHVGVRRNHPQALDPVIKSNNLLNNVLAMHEAYRLGADEALMQNADGDLAECSQSNIFVVRDGAVYTPPVSAGLLPGVTREFVLEIVQELGLPGGEARLTPTDLDTADEAFITGTTREITPVTSVDGKSIGNGAPGPQTKRLLKAFHERRRSETEA